MLQDNSCLPLPSRQDCRTPFLALEESTCNVSFFWNTDCSKLLPHQQLVGLGGKDTEESSSTRGKSPFAPALNIGVPNLKTRRCKLK